jgi:hypothetical protein
MIAADPAVLVSHEPWKRTSTGREAVPPKLNLSAMPGMSLNSGETVQSWPMSSTASALPVAMFETVLELVAAGLGPPASAPGAPDPE